MDNKIEKLADIEAIIINQRPSHSSIHTGYRPSFKVKKDYLTTGIIELVDTDDLKFMNECKARIWFVTPELYTNCISEGQVIQFQEGKIIHGYATVTKINNKILEYKKM